MRQTPHCDYGQGGVPNLDLDTCSFAVKSLHVGFKVLGGETATPGGGGGAKPTKPSSPQSRAFFAKHKAAMLRSLAATTKDPAGSGLLWSNTSAPMVGAWPVPASPVRRAKSSTLGTAYSYRRTNRPAPPRASDEWRQRRDPQRIPPRPPCPHLRPARPAGYGFQDAEVKSGCVLYSSVLYWNATRLMVRCCLPHDGCRCCLPHD